jgi:four helix bundle protein
MPGARRFEELDCWRLASQLKAALLSLCRRPAVSIDLEFVGQVRSAARSAPNNIAEGFGRRTHRDFAHFLDIARGSLMESQNLLRDALENAYITQAEYDSLRSLASRALGATTALQRYLRNNPNR